LLLSPHKRYKERERDGTPLAHIRPASLNLAGHSGRARTRSIVVNGPRTWTNQHKRQNACNVEEVAFVSGWSKLRPSLAKAQQLDRTEAIWKMNREDRDSEHNDRWNADERNEGPNQDGNATQKLSADRQPSHQLRRRNANSAEDRSKCVWSPV